MAHSLNSNKRGITLIASLMLIVFATIVVAGVTIFIVGRLSQNIVNQTHTKCIYLAQAGIHKAIYDYRVDGEITPGQTNIDSDNFFVIGTSDSLLLTVDASSWYWGPTTGPPGQRYRELLGLEIQNNSTSDALVIVSMTVSWDNSRRINAISIDGSEVWSGNEKSPANCDIDDFTLDPSGTYDIDYLEFSGNMSGAAVTIGFNMNDGSTYQIALSTEGEADSSGFTIKATGKTSGSNIYRTISVLYDSTNSKIIGGSEIDEEVTP